MSAFPLSDPNLPSPTVCAYIEDMLRELAEVASRIGERALAESIIQAAQSAGQCAAASWTPRDRYVG